MEHKVNNETTTTEHAQALASLIEAMDASNKFNQEQRQREDIAGGIMLQLLTSNHHNTERILDGYWLVNLHHGKAIVSNQPKTTKGWLPYTGYLDGFLVEGEYWHYPLWNKENHDNEIAWYKEKIARLEGK